MLISKNIVDIEELIVKNEMGKYLRIILINENEVRNKKKKIYKDFRKLIE